jgi:hypothetical protein
MRVTVGDTGLISDLLAHLRTCGCIAYPVPDGDGIEVIDPDASARDEQRRILGFVGQWAARHPETKIEFGH